MDQSVPLNWVCGQLNHSGASAVGADRAYVWHHLSQYAVLEHRDARVLVKGRARIANAVRDQLEEMNFFVGTAGNVPSALFAERVIEKVPELSRVFSINTGSEAIKNHSSWDCFSDRRAAGIEAFCSFQDAVDAVQTQRGSSQ